MAEVRNTVTLMKDTGLHAVPATEFVIEVSKHAAAAAANGVDAKRVLGAVALGAGLVAGKCTEVEVANVGE